MQPGNDRVYTSRSERRSREASSRVSQPEWNRHARHTMDPSAQNRKPDMSAPSSRRERKESQRAQKKSKVFKYVLVGVLTICLIITGIRWFRKDSLVRQINQMEKDNNTLTERLNSLTEQCNYRKAQIDDPDNLSRTAAKLGMQDPEAGQRVVIDRNNLKSYLAQVESHNTGTPG